MLSKAQIFIGNRMVTTEYDELWLTFEGRWADQAVSRRFPWDQRRPIGKLRGQLFEFTKFLDEGKALPQPEDEAQA